MGFSFFGLCLFCGWVRLGTFQIFCVNCSFLISSGVIRIGQSQLLGVTNISGKKTVSGKSCQYIRVSWTIRQIRGSPQHFDVVLDCACCAFLTGQPGIKQGIWKVSDSSFKGMYRPGITLWNCLHYLLNGTAFSLLRFPYVLIKLILIEFRNRPQNPHGENSQLGSFGMLVRSRNRNSGECSTAADYIFFHTNLL